MEGSSYQVLHAWFRGSMSKQQRALGPLPVLHRPRIRVATFNLQMLSGMVLDDIVSLNADILILNEFFPLPRSHPQMEPKALAETLRTKYGYKEGSFDCSPPWQDVTFVTVVLSRLPLRSVRQVMLDGDRHAVVVQLRDLDMCVTGLHLDVYDESGKTRLRQLQQLQQVLEELKPAPAVCVLAGDFNAVRRKDYTEEEFTKIRNHDRERDVLTEVKTTDFVQNTMKFVDCFDWAKQRPPVCSTWSGRRIDYALLKAQQEDTIQVTNAFYWPCTSSDHIPIGCDIEFLRRD